MGSLDSKVAIITGGAGSIGLATAKLFVDEGAKVMLVGTRQTKLDAALTQLPSDRAAAIAGDVSNPKDTEAYIEATLDHFGQIDILFSNAGNPGLTAPLPEYPDEEFEHTWRVHVMGAFLASKHCMPKMNDGGSIIINCSVAGLIGAAGEYGYITAKHAQIGLMRCLSKEGAPRKIRCNTIHPGPTENDFQRKVEDSISQLIGRDAGEMFDQQIPLGRHAQAKEIAKSVLYLASDSSSFTTGSQLVVDGGMSV